MSRAFDFNETEKRIARLRQWGLCASCGDSLDDLWEHAHHVIPNQTGDPSRPEDDFLRSAENCVILCEDCHSSAHDGNWGGGAVATAEWYAYSHGSGATASRGAWITRIEAEWNRLRPAAPAK